MKKVTVTTVMMLFFVTCIFCVGTTNVLGQEKGYPDKPISLYLGFPPGGGAAIAAQGWVEVMKKYLKQPLVLNYKPGGAQVIAAEFVSNSRPDGYTLMWMGFADMITKVTLEQGEIKYRLEDLDSIGGFTCYPTLLVVPTDSPYKTIEDLIAAAKKSPGKLSYGSTGAGGLHHLIPEYFAMKTGIKLNQVPFQGGGPQITALLGNHVDMGTSGVATFLPYLKPGGGLRGLILFDKQRHASMPDVPCSAEKGIDVQVGIWFGIQGPKGMPKEVKDRLIDAFKKTAEDPQTKDQLGKLGYGLVYLSPVEEDKRVRVDYKQFLEVWKNIGLIK